MTLLELRQKLTKNVEELKKLNDKALSESRDLTEEEYKRFEEIQKENETLKKQIERTKALEDEDAELRKVAPEDQHKANPAEAGELKPKDKEDRTRVEVTKNPKLFRSFGDFLQRVKIGATPEERGSARVVELYNYDKELRAAAGINETVSAEGGFLVEKEFADTLLTKMYTQGELASRVRKIPLSNPNSSGIKIPAVDETSRAAGSRWGGVRAYWVAEAETPTATKPKFAQISLDLNKLICLCHATSEALDDSSVLETVIGEAFPDEMNFAINEAIVNGTGAGQPLGIVSAPCVVTVDKETDQAAATIKAENIVKMYSRMYSRSRPNAVWLINQDVEPQLNLMTINVGTGGSAVYTPANGLSDSPYSTLMGRPVIPIEQCQTLGTAGDIIFADLSQYVMIDKGGIKFASSIHVYFTSDQQSFRFVYRCDGQPWWTSSLTPAHGSNTQSPFITLQTRS